MRTRNVATLEDVTNVGPATAGDLRQIGIDRPAQLSGRDPYALYAALCAATETHQDPCVLDVFIAAVRYMEGAPARPWWRYSAERKRAFAATRRSQPRARSC